MLRRILTSLLAATLVFAALAYAAVPGMHRVATPGLFGLAQPGERLFTDAPDRAAEFEAMIADAEARVAAFFGDLERSPIWVICTTPDCEAEFGIRANGTTIGASYVVIGRKGLNPRTMTHERAHIELHRYLGPSDILEPRFPAWFDEGLATHIAGDTRVRRPANPRDADWITQARRIRDWHTMRAAGHSAADRYGAAVRLVEEIEARAGRAGLAALVEAVGAGADFDTEYRRLIAP